MLSNEELLFMYGKNAVISRKDAFVLVHLDRPSPEMVRERTEEFDPEEFFCADCPLCLMVRESGIVIFDDSIFEEDEILLD